MTPMHLSRRSSPCAPFRQGGRTVIELMISIALGLMIVAAVGSLYYFTSRTAQTSEQVSSAEERGRLAMFFLSEPIAMAGSGNIASASLSQRLGLTSLPGAHLRACENGRFQDPNLLNNPADFTCVPSPTGAPGDQLFVAFQAESDPAIATAQGTAPMTDCLGQGAPAVGGVPTARNLYSVEFAPSGVLEFGCAGNGGAAFGALVRDVEMFKVFFAFDSDAFANAGGPVWSPTVRPSAIRTANELNLLMAQMDPFEDQVMSAAQPWNSVIAVYVCVQLRTTEAGTTADGISYFRPCPQTAQEAATGTAEIQSLDGIARRTVTQVFTLRSRAQALTASGLNQ
jgi:type IV pilus assembly protein PilW